MKKLLFLVFIAVLGLDQWSKLKVQHSMELYESFPVIDGFFNITYVLNPGAAFGMLAKLDERFRQAFFIVITLLAIAAVSYLMYKEFHLKLRGLSYTLILSGAVGNFIDRIYIGKVVDFLDVYIGSSHWPAFNVADSAITVGITLLIIDMVYNKRDFTNDN